MRREKRERREKGRIKDRMDLKTEGAVKTNSTKCWLKWTMRGQLLAPGGLSSGHQASHHGDANVTMATDRPRYTDAGPNTSLFSPSTWLIRTTLLFISPSFPSFSVPQFLNKAFTFPLPWPHWLVWACSSTNDLIINNRHSEASSHFHCSIRFIQNENISDLISFLFSRSVCIWIFLTHTDK